jgi:hypothetical protein
MGDLPYERLIVAVQAVAAMEGAVEATVSYVKARTAFGKSLLEFQNTRFAVPRRRRSPRRALSSTAASWKSSTAGSTL